MIYRLSMPCCLNLLIHASATEPSLEHMRMACVHSLVGLLVVKHQQTDATGTMQQLISWAAGGSQDCLYKHTNAFARSGHGINLHTTSVKAMHIQWHLHLLLHCTDGIFQLDLEYMEQLTTSSGNSFTRGMLSCAKLFCWPIQSLAIHTCARYTRVVSKLSGVVTSLIFMLHFYHLTTDDPGWNRAVDDETTSLRHQRWLHLNYYLLMICQLGVLHSLRASCCLRGGECHDPILPVLVGRRPD
jgi:hypothetical protein